MINPALSGVSGTTNLSLIYYNYYPGQGYDLNSFFMSFDTYLPALHGGAGIYASNQVLGGMINELQTGFGYAYHLKATEELYINAGLTAAIINRSLNRGQIVLPDQIDPIGGNILPPGEQISYRNHTVFDVGAGFLFTYKKISGGFSLNHFAEPDISGTGISSQKLKRSYTVQLSGEFNEMASGDLSLFPLLSFHFAGDRYWISSGASVRYKIISVNALITGDNGNNLNMQTGLTAFAGKVAFYYSYKFNIISQGGQFPFSLMHVAGVTISLNSVDKRKLIKTINFPEL